MTTTPVSDVLATLDRVVDEVISKHALEVDRTGSFPEASIATLADAGLLGLISDPSVGGLGHGPRTASLVLRRIAAACGSTAMVVCMHYCGTAVLEKYASSEVRKEAAAGRHLSTLAFSESGSRSHFWAPVGTAKVEGDTVHLDASKSWVTSAKRATAYVWSSKPASGEGASTIWLVPADAAGLEVKGPFDGLGLRGNDSSPVLAKDVKIPLANRLGDDGAGFGVMMETVLPIFNILNASVSLGFMQAACARTLGHVSGTKLEHLSSALRELPTIRNYVARIKNSTDMVEALLGDTLDAIEQGREDTMLRVLQSKAVAGETATEVLDLAMRVCGGAAFRKDVGVERYFRDARAAGVMAPTTDVLYDFIGKAITGMDLF